jgi:hypothetical protein
MYLLPCHHIFHLNTVLTAAKWRECRKLFENNGMQIYETIGTVLVPQEEELPGPDRVRVQSLLHLREMRDRQSQQLHAVHEILRMRGVPEEETSN